MTLRVLIRLIVLILTALGGWSAARVRTMTALPTPPALPAEVTARPGHLAVIRADANSRVCWHVCPAPQPPDVLQLGDGKELVFVAAQAGRYELIAWSAAGDVPSEAAHCVVKVEPEAPPAPPDAFQEKLRAAWSAETDPQRFIRRDLLAGVFRIAANDFANSANLKTVGELLAGVVSQEKSSCVISPSM
jgi:hypothetical protein